MGIFDKDVGRRTVSWWVSEWVGGAELDMDWIHPLGWTGLDWEDFQETLWIGLVRRRVTAISCFKVSYHFLGWIGLGQSCEYTDPIGSGWVHRNLMDWTGSGKNGTASNSGVEFMPHPIPFKLFRRWSGKRRGGDGNAVKENRIINATQLRWPFPHFFRGKFKASCSDVT